MSDTVQLIGTPRFGGVLVVCDHAGRKVPEGVELGIDGALFAEHIGHDIGTAAIAARMAENPGTAAFLARYSRLVVDLNRTADDVAAVPVESDGRAIPGNLAIDREARIAAYHAPYHAALEDLLDATPQGLVVFLHSFTPQLATDRSARPWQCAVLYDEDPRGAKLAKDRLESEGFTVGDQEPYSGKLYNATIRRHAEDQGRPYLYLEIRQDLIANEQGQAEWANRLQRLCNDIAMELM